MRLSPAFRAVAAGAAALCLASACAPGPTMADEPRTVAKRSASDQRLGDETHPKIMAEFGGEIADARLKAYVRDIGMRLARESEQPNGPWTFTVLDSPVVNAFALPGGYVYVTRGLIALANDEAELAGVIGHEIGHVTGAHTARRQERATIAQLGVLGATVLGAIAGLDSSALRAIGDLGSTIGQGYVASFSREQELEADRLGVRYIARAGYDPMAEADFLENLQASSRLQGRISGQGYDPNRIDFLATHPATAERVREAVAAARRDGVDVDGDRPRHRERFLAAIDGMVYGDSARQGFVRGATFSHPELRFTFTVPQGFQIQNSAAQVVAAGPDGSGVIFDGDKDQSGPMDRYVERVWAASIQRQARTGRLTNLRRLTINGLPAAAAEMAVETRAGVRIARMTAIRYNNTIYRFLGLQPQGNDRVGRLIDRAAASFRGLSAKEAAALKPYRITIHTVKGNEDVARLARRQPFENFKRERFRVLNGLPQGGEVRRGQQVKLVVE